MSQTKEENSQANLTQENSETEENTQEEAPEDEVDSQEEDSQEDTEEEDETDEEDMEGTEEHHQSEVEELVKAVAPPVKKDKAEKKQRPISVEPKKKFVDDVPKQQSPKKQPVPKGQSPKQKTTGKVVDDVTVPPEEGCCGCKVPWARWEELIIAYLHIIIAVSSGLAGAGLSSVVQTFEDTFQNNITLTPAAPLNSTSCESYLSDSIEIIVTVIYTVIVALFLAQVITLIVLGSQTRYKHANFVFLHLRALITMFTTVYFIVGWSGALGCVTLNILAIVTTMIEVVLTLIEYFKEAKKMGREFMKDCFPQALPDDNNVEPLEVM